MKTTTKCAVPPRSLHDTTPHYTTLHYTTLHTLPSARPEHDIGRHATKVRGLEAYGIDPAAFGKQVQKRFACSTAAQPAPVSFLFVCLASFVCVVCVRDQPQLGNRCFEGARARSRVCSCVPGPVRATESVLLPRCGLPVLAEFFRLLSGGTVDPSGHQRKVPRADAAGAPGDGAGGSAVGRDGHPAEILDDWFLQGCQASEGTVIVVDGWTWWLRLRL